MKKIALPFVALMVFISSHAGTPTWANDVACLLYSHCTTCHHDNGIAPFSLTTYSDAFGHMANISYDVNNHIMPPFPPDRNYQHYQGERYLTSQELGILNAWISAGGPEGDSMQAPQMPTYVAGPVISNPDFTAVIPTYTVPSITSDLYRCFVVSNPFPQTKYITGLEVIPGNNTAVHHVQVFTDTSSTPLQLDNADPNPGYTEFGGTGSASSQLVGVWVPGSQPYFLPTGMGIEVPAGSSVILQIHYPAGSSGKVDSTRINLQLASGGLRKVYVNPVLSHYANMTNGPLVVAPNAIDTFYEKYTVPAKVTVLGVGPHAHLVCNYMQCFGVQPNGDTVPLITINNWNFHWQGMYNFKSPIVLPLGTKLYGKAIYDNTANNPLNPNSPPKTIYEGEATTNEMMMFFFPYTLYQPGDETTVYDTTTSIHPYENCSYSDIPAGINDLQPIRVSVFPNPTSGFLDVAIAGAMECTARVTDLTGNTSMAAQFKAGYNTLDISNLASGMYFITLTDNTGNMKSQTVRVVKE